MKNYFILILILLCFFPNTFLGQENSILPKNSIKGNLIPPFGGIGIITTIGFERQIGKNLSTDLTSSYLLVGSHGGNRKVLALMPGIRYYVPIDKFILRNTWATIYLIYAQDLTEVIFRKEKMYGAGIGIGKRLFLSKDKNWILDIGFGTSVNKHIKTNSLFCTQNEKFPYYFPRPILVIGYNF